MDALAFLDANVLFSAAWSADAGLRVLWSLQCVRLVTSDYALQEATRNLDTPEQLSRLDELMESVTIVAELPRTGVLFTSVDLPEKDMPILLAAIEARATHLITGDKRHFGPLWG